MTEIEEMTMEHKVRETREALTGSRDIQTCEILMMRPDRTTAGTSTNLSLDNEI